MYSLDQQFAKTAPLCDIQKEREPTIQLNSVLMHPILSLRAVCPSLSPASLFLLHPLTNSTGLPLLSRLLALGARLLTLHLSRRLGGDRAKERLQPPCIRKIRTYGQGQNISSKVLSTSKGDKGPKLTPFLERRTPASMKQQKCKKGTDIIITHIRATHTLVQWRTVQGWIEQAIGRPRVGTGFRFPVRIIWGTAN